MNRNNRRQGRKLRKIVSGSSIAKDLETARSQLSISNQTRAAEIYKNILQLKPNCFEALNNLGMIMQAQGELAVAERLYRLAIKSEPNSAEAYNNLGNVANATNNIDKALQLYRKAISLKPNYPEALYNAGTVLHKTKNIRDAVTAYRMALKCNPRFLDAYCNLGIALQELGNSTGALDCYKNALAINSDHPLAQHLASSLQGNETDTAPLDYVERLFDECAENFEHSLVEELGYSIPSVLRNLMEPYIRKYHEPVNVLDLGCGTGLMGVQLRSIAGNLVGVDISKNMILESKKKGIYDSLYATDIVKFIRQTEDRFDLVVATDVFVYIGNIEPIFESTLQAMNPMALLSFSIESPSSIEKDYTLQASGRYAHSRAYIERIAKQYGYIIKRTTPTRIRKENNIWIEGYCCLLQVTS